MSDADVSELLDLAGPPAEAVLAVDWAAVERDLGFALPSSYRTIAERYGPGRFGGLKVYSPAARDPDNDLRGHVRDEAANLTANRADAGGRWALAHPVEPVEGGLVGWATAMSSSGVRGAYWLREGADPDAWRIVVLEEALYPQGWTYTGSTAAFLVALMRRALDIPFARASLWGEPVFTPSPTEVERRPRKRGLLGRLRERP